MGMLHIYSMVCNRPAFVRLQVRTFECFAKTGFVLHVVVNTPSKELEEELVKTSTGLGIEALVCPFQADNPSRIHANGVQWAWDNYVVKRHRSDTVFLIDSDMFPCEDFTVRDLLGECSVASLLQARGEVVYWWPGFLAMDMERLSEPETVLFSPKEIDGQRCDTGGASNHYIRKHNLVCRQVGQKSLSDSFDRFAGFDFSGYKSEFVCMILCDGKFLHYVGGSGWAFENALLNDPTPEKTAVIGKLLEYRCKQQSQSVS